MWGEKDVLPLRGENTELPLYLRARDVDNESYLPAGSQYMTSVMTLEVGTEEQVEESKTPGALKEELGREEL